MAFSASALRRYPFLFALWAAAQAKVEYLLVLAATLERTLRSYGVVHPKTPRCSRRADPPNQTVPPKKTYHTFKYFC